MHHQAAPFVPGGGLSEEEQAVQAAGFAAAQLYGLGSAAYGGGYGGYGGVPGYGTEAVYGVSAYGAGYGAGGYAAVPLVGALPRLDSARSWLTLSLSAAAATPSTFDFYGSMIAQQAQQEVDKARQANTPSASTS